MQTQHLFAAVDLGSNSFRLEIGQLEAGHLRRVDYLKETVRQGNGLDADRQLGSEAMQRGWSCLARFGERLAGFDATHVRAVATQTLREARNREVFLQEAQRILGFPIEVIAGREEARLIYLGVSHLLPQSDERRLVVDIGGRSTELILGHGPRPLTLASYRVGSVAWSMKYFPSGQWTSAAFRTAEVAAKAFLDEALSAYPRSAWDTAYGSSGTIGAVADILRAAGWPEGVITREALDWLQARLLKARQAEQLQLEGLKDDRRAVIGGGLAVLRALFELLEIETMQAAQGALRHGALFDLIDRENPAADVRSGQVEALARRFAADPTQSERVGRTALQLLDQLASGSALAHQQRELQWAARLHEIGMQISHSEHHKHGAYILENSDMPGFTLDELHRLGVLVLGHRGKLRKLEQALGDTGFVCQLLALRLAVILCHARRQPDSAALRLHLDARYRSFVLAWPPSWAALYPQSAHLLQEECLAWQKTAWSLALHEAAAA